MFLYREDHLFTPDLTNCGIAGIMRGLVIEQAEKRGIPLSIQDLRLADLKSADGLFLTSSLTGICPIRRLGEWNYELDYMNKALIGDVMKQGFEN